MAKLNQTQRNYFIQRINEIQRQKLFAYQERIKAEIPNLDLTFDDKRITLEAVQSGRATLKTAEEILALRGNSNGTYWNFNAQLSELFNIVVNEEARVAKAEYDRRVAAFMKAQLQQAARFNDIIMLGGDDAALEALSRLEAEEVELPD